MAHPWHHAERSARIFGGSPEEYHAIHAWFDESKRHYADLRHRAYRHHTEGIFECEKAFGPTLVLSTGKHVPTRLIAEQHVKDDLGMIPTLQDWLKQIQLDRWMLRPKRSLTNQEQSGSLETEDIQTTLSPAEESHPYIIVQNVSEDKEEPCKILEVIYLTEEEINDAHKHILAENKRLLPITSLIGSQLL